MTQKQTLTGWISERRVNGQVRNARSLRGSVGAGTGGTYDYNALQNKPSINNVELVGNKSLNDLGIDLDHKVDLLSNTTSGWDSVPALVSAVNTIYVYTDHQQKDGQNIAGIKIGDGQAYVIDLPFLDAVYAAHILDTDIHVTLEERAFWNSKVRCYMGDGDSETLIFTTN